VAVEETSRTDRSSLLNQLRIDRSEPPPSSKAALWWTLLVSVLLIGGGLAYWLWPRGTSVRTAVVQSAVSAGGERIGGASLLDASGYIVARRRATVASKVTGKVMEVNLEEGQKVTAGQVIAKLDDSNSRALLAQSNAQLSQAQANLAAAQTAFDDAKPIFDRNERQKKAAVISLQSFDEAQAQFNAARTALSVAQSTVESARAGVTVAQRAQDDTIVRAPFTGIVTEKSAQPGEMVSPISAGGGFTRTGIGTIVDMDSLEVEVDVSENFINRVTPQQPVSIKLNAYSDWEIPGSVIAAIPTADRSKATVKVRIAIKQKDPRIIPEMGARVSFLSEKPAQDATSADASARGVIVPSEAVTESNGTSIIYLVRGTTVERRAVRLGAKTDAGQVLLAGAEPGNTVAVSNLAQLQDGARIRIEKP
jgi:RND family efflux transporter MFP subunit